MHFKRTLASFSLENKVSLVTGGARGLGLVMAQGLVASGSDLAIVDLNSMFYLSVDMHMWMWMWMWIYTNADTILIQGPKRRNKQRS